MESPTAAYTGEMDEGERLFWILKTRDLKYLYRVVEGRGEEGKKEEEGGEGRDHTLGTSSPLLLFL